LPRSVWHSAVVVRPVGDHPLGVEGRTPRVSLDEELGEMEVGEQVLVGPFRGQAHEPMQHRQHVPRVDRTSERPLYLAA
jgi:hypothetical protein